MAKYQWTGAGETVGAAPSLFSNIWNGALSEWEVQEDLAADNENKVLAFVNLAGSSVRRALQLNSAGSAISGRVDIRGRVWKAGNSGSLLFSQAYLAGASGSETGVGTSYTSAADGWRIFSYTSGTYNTEAPSNVDDPEGWYRFRVLHDPAASADRHKLWVWADADPEPVTPIAIKNSASNVALGSGGLGVGAFAAEEGYIDWISFGTGGDDADDLSSGGAGPTLSSVPATAFPSQSRTVTGTGFGATQGTGGLTIGGVSQTITSWSDTEIIFTAVLGTNNYGTGKTLEVTTDAATTVSDTIELVADTANGFGYVDMSSPNTTDESSVAFNTTPTVVTGDQFEWEDFNSLGNLTIDAQGFVTNVDTEGTFRGRFWDATDSTWGAVESFNATIPESPPAFAPTVGTITKDDTTASIPFTYVGGDADSFEYSTDAGGTWTTTTSPISLSGMTAETSYSGLVRAVNTGGNGPTASFSFTTNAVGVVDNWPFGKGIEYAATQNWEWGKRHPKTGMRVRVYK